MRTLPAGLQDHLDSGTTTLCHCWRLTLTSGETLGFTDHDRALVFDGTRFEADAGFTGSDIESSLGLSVDNLETTGALESGRLDEARLRAGDFDHASVEIWRVNWAEVAQRLLMRKGHLGEVTYGDGSFRAEVRGLAHLLGQTRGRVYQRGCDAMLGDGRCTVNLNAPGLHAETIVNAIDESAVTVTGASVADDWFTRGEATWLSGAGAGRTLRIKRHRNSSSGLHLSFWQAPDFAVSAGDGVRLTAGCDKQFATCQAKFSNAANFRGFPHMPGTDFVTVIARQGDSGNDGSKRT
jgi:uncharacterized phage protein (TIGR02218 family)